MSTSKASWIPSSQAVSPRSDVAAAVDAVSSAVPWLPDPQVLTRLANEMFSAWPGSVPVASGVSPPVAAEAVAAPATSWGIAVPSSGTVASGAAAPRPSFAGASVPMTSWPTVPLPDEADLGALPSPLAPPRSAAPLSAPPKAPVVDSPTFEPPGSSFYFLDGAKPPSCGEVKFPGDDSLSARTNREKAHPAFDVQAIRRDFRALHQLVNGRPLIWLDSAATTQKPQSVIDATSAFYSRDNSNIHRGAHTLAARATDAFEGAREKVRRFIGAADAKEIVFVRGTTEAINLMAQSYGRQNIGDGNEVLITAIEHHANIVPWQLLAEQTGAVLRVAPVNDKGELVLDQFAALLGPRTKLVSVTHVANALGTINPVERIIALSHAAGVPVLVDAAQSAPHMPLNVAAMDADFLVFSGHKIFGPTGIGVLYGKYHLLDAMPPWQGGGHMIDDVTFAKSTFQHAPEKFEAGTPDIAGAVGLGGCDRLSDARGPAGRFRLRT
jgi:cysteine desulfurase / selenocysteine lyase